MRAKSLKLSSVVHNFHSLRVRRNYRALFETSEPSCLFMNLTMNAIQKFKPQLVSLWLYCWGCFFDACNAKTHHQLQQGSHLLHSDYRNSISWPHVSQILRLSLYLLVNIESICNHIPQEKSVGSHNMKQMNLTDDWFRDLTGNPVTTMCQSARTVGEMWLLWHLFFGERGVYKLRGANRHLSRESGPAEQDWYRCVSHPGLFITRLLIALICQEEGTVCGHVFNMI